MTDKIAHCLPLSDQDVILEIGPGPGSLTRSLLKRAHAGMILGIEKDARFKPVLDQLQEAVDPRFRYIMGDALNVSSDQLMHHLNLMPGDGKTLHITGNLPFNIATQLLVHWLEQLYAQSGVFEHERRVELTLMFQKEVAERIVASPKTPHRSKLSVLVQSLCKTSITHNVPASVFYPKPKVDASIVRLSPLPVRALDRVPLVDFQELLSVSFRSRRKMLRNNLPKEHVEILMEAGIDLKARAEDLSNEEFSRLAHLYHNKKGCALYN